MKKILIGFAMIGLVLFVGRMTTGTEPGTSFFVKDEP